MATTDTRSGFRLPWSSDRSHDTAPETPADAATPAEQPAAEAPADASVAWPSSDLNARLGLDAHPRPADPTPAPAEGEIQEPVMVDAATVPQAPAAPRKPSKLMAELSAAIRATAETARAQALSQLESDVASVVEQIRVGAKEGESDLRVRADEDIARIKDWSRSEIARIKAETEHKVDARKLGLDEELAAHAAAIEHRVGEVEGTATAYRTEMDAYAERLGEEDDPARLATMAESMPEAPALDALADLADLELDLDVTPIVEPEAVVAVDDALEAEAAVEAEAPRETSALEGLELTAVLEAAIDLGHVAGDDGRRAHTPSA